MPLYFGERLGLAAMVVVSRGEAGAAYTTMHDTTVDTHQAGHCWWIFRLLGEGHRGIVFHLCVKYKVEVKLKMPKVGEAKKMVRFRPSGLRKNTAAVPRRWLVE